MKITIIIKMKNIDNSHITFMDVRSILLFIYFAKLDIITQGSMVIDSVLQPAPQRSVEELQLFFFFNFMVGWDSCHLTIIGVSDF